MVFNRSLSPDEQLKKALMVLDLAILPQKMSNLPSVKKKAS